MYKRVVVPLDESRVAEAIIPFILEIAGPLDLEVVLVRVLQPMVPVVVEATRQVEVEDVEARREAAEEYLRPVVLELERKGVRVHTMVRRGEPAPEIVAGAREAGADLIAMTTHGRGGLGRLLFGSVAEAVLRRAEIPVFLMRLTEADVKRRATREAHAGA